MWIARGMLGMGLVLAAAAAVRAAGPDFTTQVRPILARHCLKCHGPDEAARESGLRLDLRDSALAKAESGVPAIVPGQPQASELVRRIEAEDESERMPPPAAKNPLTAAEKQVLRDWIAAGADYRPHWAFVPPVAAPLPRVKQTSWPLHELDYFVLARLEAVGLSPAPPADRYQLVRRVYLDLLGLPPTPEEADAFVADTAPDAYERLVDRLLASPHYGERWARRWLDLARYADTNGYEKDRPRSIWLYRDWVIGALNRDLPFDQFTIEQLAGDMLPQASLDQRIATGFHRNTMLNEEGGIDPLEFRFHAMTDRVATTGAAWLGLTTGCAQCHTHKYDPLTQRDYYALFGLLNNCDEPTLEVPQPELAARRAALEARIAALEQDLPNRFPPEVAWQWETPPPRAFAATSGAKGEALADHSIRVGGGEPPADDVYTITVDTATERIGALKLEALVDPNLPGTGPGRTPHGNFVVTELAITAAPVDAPDQAAPIKLAAATADFAQAMFPAGDMLDGNDKTGWAIHGPGKWNVNRAATLTFEKPVGFAGGTRFVIKLEQKYGTQHVLGRLRIALARPQSQAGSIEELRAEHFERKFAAWQQEQAARATHWRVVRPQAATANVPILTILDDGSVLASGDATKRDEYDVTYRGAWQNITALRLEVLPDASLPKQGPGRTAYEGPQGDFFLSELSLLADGQPVPLAKASQSFADGGKTASAAIDGDPQSGWSINGGQGRRHVAIFELAAPLAAAQELKLHLLCERYFAAGVGRFRLSVTDDLRSAEAHALPDDVERLLRTPPAERTADDVARMRAYYLSVAPELAAVHAEIKQLRAQLPAYPTTLVLAERPAGHTRPTFLHKRGEFLQPVEAVAPNVPAFLPPLPPGATANRLAFARWLVDPRNPLVARVTVNRQWAAFFGRGIVRTTEDFGFQGEPPTHPELLDWLAVDLVRQGWSLKRLHRQIVTSATYRQSSRLTPELLARPPVETWLAHGPRGRLDAEQIRDALLAASGLLAAKFGGPSVFPPQPPGITKEGTYGPLEWQVSAGADRYRRALYTFAKRSAPYAMFATFDAPSGEACIARREVTNTPLQALTLLNNPVVIEAAQALGAATVAGGGTPDEQAERLFRRCLTRPPTDGERAQIVAFYQAQKKRLAAGELKPGPIAGPGATSVLDRAAWTLVARAVLNLDEMITKE